MDDLQEIKGLLAFLWKVQIDDKPGPVICFQLKLCFFKLIKQIIRVSWISPSRVIFPSSI